MNGQRGNPILFTADDPQVKWRGLNSANLGQGSEFSHCVFEYSNKRAMTLIDCYSPAISDCVFRKNSVSGNHGGALRATGLRSDLFIARSTFVDNETDQHGGAIWVNGDARLYVEDSLFLRNSANPNSGQYNSVGGAIYLATSQGCEIL